MPPYGFVLRTTNSNFSSGGTASRPSDGMGGGEVRLYTPKISFRHYLVRVKSFRGKRSPKELVLLVKFYIRKFLRKIWVVASGSALANILNLDNLSDLRNSLY